jgi:tungstate transport system substrate-binding protein
VKRFSFGILCISLIVFSAGIAVHADQQQQKIMLASTIGPIDAGIVGALEDAFTKKTGIAVEHTGAGTGKAIQMAETGKYDLLLVHAKALEEKFVADGFGTKRYDLMYNDFVILGPASDPAKIRGMKDAAAALKAIAQAQASFVTRGDKSGTHVKELEVWKKSKITLQILVERDDILLNYMTLIPVNPAKFPQVHHAEAMQFVEWLQGREAQTIIRDFGKDKYGEPLFFPNSPEGKKL